MLIRRSKREELFHVIEACRVDYSKRFQSDAEWDWNIFDAVRKALRASESRHVKQQKVVKPIFNRDLRKER